MGDRGVSSCLEAVLWCGKGSGEKSGGDPAASFAFLEGFLGAGGLSLANRDQFV